MKTRFYLLLLLCCMPLTSVIGQNVKLTVVAENPPEPLVGVSVRVLTADSVFYKGYQTNDKGVVEMKIPLKQCRIHVSYIGYKPQNLTVLPADRKEMDLGTLVLQEDKENTLREVVVTAQSVKEDITKTIVFPTALQVKISPTCLDLLHNLHLPGLEVNSVLRSVSIAGTSGIVFRIDGRNSSLTDVIALPVSQIKKVEYSRTPTIRELESNSGVINIILKKRETGTFLSQSADGAFSTGFLNGNTDFKHVFAHSELALNYDVYWRDYKKRRMDEDETYTRPSDTLSFHREGRDTPFNTLIHNVNLGYTIYGTKDIFSIRFLNNIGSEIKRYDFDVFQNGSNIPLFGRYIYTKFKGYTPSLDLYYIHKANEKEGFEMNIVGTLQNTTSSRELTDTYTSDTYRVNNSADGKRKSIVLEGFYYNSLHPVHYNFGIKTFYHYTRNIYNQLTDTISMKQLNVYPYVSIEGQVKKVSYSLGTGFKILHSVDLKRSKTYCRNLSTFTLFYNYKNGLTVRNTLQYTPFLPSMSDLSDVTQRRDSLMVTKGNPHTKPAQKLYDILNFTYQIRKDFKMNLTLNAAKTFNPIDARYYYDSAIKSYVREVNNQTYNRVLGAELNLDISSLFKIVELSGGIGWNNYKTSGEGYLHTKNNLYWGISYNIRIKDFSIFGVYSKPKEELYGEVVIINENNSSIGVSYNKKNWNLYAGVMYPFSKGSKYIDQSLSSVVRTHRSFYIRDNGNMFYIGGYYRISWGKSSREVHKRLNNGDWDNGISKVQTD